MKIVESQADRDVRTLDRRTTAVLHFHRDEVGARRRAGVAGDRGARLRVGGLHGPIQAAGRHDRCGRYVCRSNVEVAGVRREIIRLVSEHTPRQTVNAYRRNTSAERRGERLAVKETQVVELDAATSV